MDFYRRTQNAARTCRHFGISRQTFYRWQRRYDPYDLTTMEERSHCPRRRRHPTWSFPLEEKVLTLRLQFPRWGKGKLAVLLHRQHLAVSASMVGRILTRLKRHGRLVEPPSSGVAGSAARNPSNTRSPRPFYFSFCTATKIQTRRARRSFLPTGCTGSSHSTDL
jgi:putative transposase